MTLTYTYESDFFPELQIGAILQAQLAQIGINLKLQQLSSAAWTNIAYGTEALKDRPNLLPYQWWPDYNDPYDAVDTLIDSAQSVPNGNNIGQYHDKQVDAVLAKMRYADDATVISNARTLQKLLFQDPPAIYVDEPAQTLVEANNLQGYVFNPIELRTFYFYVMHR